MQIITTTFIQNVILGSHQLHEQLSIVEARMIESAIVSMLTESFCENEQTLKYLARLLSPMSYMDVINARRERKYVGTRYAIRVRQKNHLMASLFTQCIVIIITVNVRCI